MKSFQRTLLPVILRTTLAIVLALLLVGPAAAAPTGPYAVAAKAVNLRAGPGTGYPVIAAAVAGKQYEITGRNADASWLRVCCVNNAAAWVARSVVTLGGPAVNTVAVVQVAPPPAAPKAPASAAKPAGQKWVLVADSAADFPGGQDHNHWYYLWTEGRNSFRWQDGQHPDPNGCYRDGAGIGMEVCRDAIKADPRGDIAVQWKASRGGTYRFEWDSPWLKFYKHADFMGTQGKGIEMPFSAVVRDVIEWEMFFWVAGDSTSYHIKVFRLDETASAAPAPAPVPAAGGRSEIGVMKQSAGVAVTVLTMEKTFQVRSWLDAAPGDIALIISVEIANVGRASAPYNPLFFDVRDSSGNIWRSSALAPDPDLPAGYLARGEKVRGNVAFIVPQTSSGFTVLYDPTIYGAKLISVRLGD